MSNLTGSGQLTVLEKYLDAVNGKIKSDQFPDVTILMYAGQNLKLINNSFILFTKGYLRSCLIFQRAISEQLILAMCFKEFPLLEEEYRKLKPKEFFKAHKLTRLLKEIDRNGKIFKAKPEKGMNYWRKILYRDLYSQASRYLHPNNEEIIFTTLDDATGKYFKGPRLRDVKLLKSLLRMHFEDTLFTILVLGKTFNIVPTEGDEEDEIISESVVTAEALRK